MINEEMDVFKVIDNVIAYGRLSAADNEILEKFKALKIKLRAFQSERLPTGKLGNNGRPEYITKGNSLFATYGGEIVEESEWYKRARALIKESGEINIFRRLLLYADDLGWFRTKEEAEKYALALHISRIFENVKWVCYHEFNDGLKWA